VAIGDSGIGTLFRSPIRGRLLLLGSLWFVYYIGNYAWLTLATDLFSKHGLSLSQSITSLSVTGFGFVAGAVVAVYTSDHIDRRRSAAAICLVWAATLVAIGFTASTVTIPILGFVASFTIGFAIPILYTITGENFPTPVRATGVSLSDGFGHIGGAFCGQIIFGVEAWTGFAGAFLAMAATGVLAALLVSFAGNHTAKLPA